ncbi:MAG TPA: fumarylacetoacetate hydrolase family protein [Vitreimonas sp.]|nr:fumarylacetoacetate hydrolase family protein [Vitreimonas sp.]
MRFATFNDNHGSRLGVIDGTDVIDVGAGDTTHPQLLDIISGQRSFAAIAEAAASSKSRHPLSGVRLLAPLIPRKNVFAVGRNYFEHVREGAEFRQAKAEAPEVPVFFTKAPTAVTGPGDVALPSVTAQFDWEAELAVIIGRRGRDIPAERALDHVFGYAAANDLTARDLQFRHTQWFKGKSLDGSCPLGPWVVTADEVNDPQSLDIECRVNGQVKQKSNTSQMIFSVAQIIEALSAGLTLEPGDVILTGTPEGVGFARKPPEFLQEGDTVEVAIERVGTLTNALIAEDR